MAFLMVSMSAYPIPPTPQPFFVNHKSALDHPEVIDMYIEAEQKAGRYSRGFSPAELELLIGPFATAPLGVVPKPNSSKFRIIQDLSFPRNNSLQPSINSSIDSNHFPTSWGTFDETAALVLSLPPGCQAATFDIESAYRIVPLAITQQASLCICWRDLVYVDRALMFGLASSAGVFGSVADMIVAIYQRAGYGPIKKWVDDFFVVRLPNQTWSEHDFIQVTAWAGVPWSLAKTRPLATQQRYIGFDWDLEGKTVIFPEEKLHNLQATVHQWLTPRARFSQKDAQSLHGKLIHASCIFRLTRPFLRSLAYFASSFQSAHAQRIPPQNVHSDLEWIMNLLAQSPSRRPLYHPSPLDLGWWGDASSSFGIGIVVDRYWAVWRWQKGFTVGPNRSFDIGWAEATAVEMALRTLLFISRL